MQNLSVAIIQADLAWENALANYQKFETLIEPLSADIIILPEMFSTGFSMSPHKFAQDEQENIVWLRALANKKQCVITGSLMTKDGDKFFNRLYWVLPDGNYQTYNKRHLFTMAGEERTYSPGKDKLIVSYKGWKICPLICFDLRFPVFIRNKENYDVLIFVANWPERRAHHWRTLLQARAIENQCYTIGVNRIGEDDNQINHIGNSMIISPQGEILAELSSIETAFTTSLTYDRLTFTRRYMPFLNEMDDFEVK